MSAPASILIVGGNRGIGLGIVEESLKRDSSAAVYTTARDPAKADGLTKLNEAFPGRLTVLKFDMLDEPSVTAAVAELKKHTPALDTIIINAGILLGEGRIEDLSPADLLKNLEGNVVGPHIITKAFSPFLLESKAAKRTLAYISSGVGSVGASKQVGEFVKKMYNVDYIPNSGYATTKTALNGLGRQWADSLEPKGVAVILVHPGAVFTDMNQGEGLITVEESAKGVLDVVAKSTIEEADKGIHSYDGTTFPW